MKQPGISCETVYGELLAYFNRELATDLMVSVAAHLDECERCQDYARIVENAICREIYDQVDSYLDRELNADDFERVQKHLAMCTRCSAHFRFDGRVLHFVREQAKKAEIEEPVVARIMSQFRTRLRAALAQTSQTVFVG
ncbi:MAG: zf-HC2 domain-containing protein [Chloroflexota bacterium]